MIIRTRFAPSPTGFLHVGGLRTALYAYCFAKQNKGKFVLRIEDTDQKRFVEGALESLLRSLYWAGVIPDEGVMFDDKQNIIQKGDCGGSYIQSERLEIYRKHADELMKNGHAYRCFCTEERLEEMRQFQQLNKLPTGYDGHCRELDPSEAEKRAAAGEKHVIRMKMPKEGETVFNDLIRGEVRIKNALIDDQVIIKSDCFPTYHLAVVVDDHFMKITHVIRGEEWLSSVPKHIQLYKYFGWGVPEMAHFPLIVNPDKTKLSKRQGDVAVEDYVRKGYLKEAIVNFIALLGWNPGTEQEMYSLDELVRDFDIAKVGKSGAIFNLQKLDWFNKEYLKKLDLDELVSVARPFLLNDTVVSTALQSGIFEDKLGEIISLEKERVTTLAELPGAVRFVFELPAYDKEMLVWKKSSTDELKKMLPDLIAVVDTISVQDWKKEKIEMKIGEWIKEKEYSVGSVMWPLRVAMSGQDKSPGPFEIAAVLGRAETMKRLNTALLKIMV